MGSRGDCLILDEAMFLPEFGYGALLPTLSAWTNPQVWYTGSAVDQFVHDDGVVSPGCGSVAWPVTRHLCIWNGRRTASLDDAADMLDQTDDVA